MKLPRIVAPAVAGALLLGTAFTAPSAGAQGNQQLADGLVTVVC